MKEVQRRFRRHAQLASFETKYLDRYFKIFEVSNDRIEDFLRFPVVELDDFAFL